MSTTKNFSEYREALHRANPPCIPFFGMLLPFSNLLRNILNSYQVST